MIKKSQTFLWNDTTLNLMEKGKMTKETIELLSLIKGFYKKAYQKNKFHFYDFFPLEYLYIGYLENYGYYIPTEAERGQVVVFQYGKDINEAFQSVVTDVLTSHSIDYEWENRKKLEQDYTQRFGDMEYFSCLYFAEYALTKWNKYYDGNIPKNIIDYYENYLNGICWNIENNISWHFNIEKNAFEYKKNVKMKKLEKKEKETLI